MGDVAARAKVDPSVVSRVINNDPVLNIRPETRQRVLDAIRDLDYRPNSIARSLRTSKANAIALLIPNYDNPVYASIITGAESAARKQSSLLLTGSAVDGDYTFERFLELIVGGRVDGLLYAGSVTAPRSDLLRRNLVTLRLNGSVPGEGNYLMVDDERGAATAVNHLIELGHRRIGHLAGPKGSDTARRRALGYRRALAKAGIDQDPALFVPGDYTSRGGELAMNNLLSARPTAVFAANFSSAIGALKAISDKFLRVPDDISMVALHDHPLAGFLTPALATVRMPLEELGRQGVELLTTIKASGTIREIIAGPIELIPRDSTASPP